MKLFEKVKIRAFGIQGHRNKSTASISALVFVATLLFVGAASAHLGFIPSLPTWLSGVPTPTQKVEGVSVSQLAGNCPADGLITKHPDSAKPLPVPATINSNQTFTLPSGQYFLAGAFTINGQLIIDGAVEIYADTVNIGSTGFVNANAKGNNGGTGGVVTHIVTTATGAVTSRTVVSMATDGIGYCANGQPGCSYLANTAGGGASKADYVDPDGAGGGGHGGKGGGGSDHSGQPGGAANYAGLPGDYDVRMGSGGGGGYCKDGGNQCRGGRGGGSVEFYSTNFNMVTGARVFANGQAAADVTHVADRPRPNGTSTGWQQASGGGGAGGGILLSAINMNITGGTIQANGGKGGNSCTNTVNCPSDDDAGGGGGGGEVKVFHDPNAPAYVFQAAVSVNGGNAGSQAVRPPNVPESGDAWFVTYGSCIAAPPPKCTTGWNFGLSCNAVTPKPGQQMFIGANVNSFNFQNDPLDITQQLNQYETRNSTGIVYGDWWGPSFTATKGHYYKACYDVQAGSGAQPMSWGNSYAATATRFYTDSVSPGNEFDIENNIQPVGAWNHKERVFQASWGAANATATSWLEFRTGSYIGGWFTGNLNLDNVGIFDCGTAGGSNPCSNVPPCDKTLVGSTSNIISGPVRNGTFEGNSDINLNVWRHSSAAPTGINASGYKRITESTTNHYLQIQSANFFPQSVDQNCTVQFPGGSCYHWHGTQTLPNADFQLYTVATVTNNAPCNVTLPNSATGKLNSCDVRTANCDTAPVSCVGQIPPVAQVLPPFSVCKNQPTTFHGLVSAPQAILGDTHTFRWSTSGGNPSVPNPSTGSKEDPNGQTTVDTVINPGANDFTLNLDVTSTAGAGTAQDSHLITVIDCVPGTPGAYQPEPSEDIHASGRTAISPALGTGNEETHILDWREILGNLF